MAFQWFCWLFWWPSWIYPFRHIWGNFNIFNWIAHVWKTYILPPNPCHCNLEQQLWPFIGFGRHFCGHLEFSHILTTPYMPNHFVLILDQMLNAKMKRKAVPQRCTEWLILTHDLLILKCMLFKWIALFTEMSDYALLWFATS